MPLLHSPLGTRGVHGHPTLHGRPRPATAGARFHRRGPRSARGRMRGERRPDAGERRRREAGRPRLGLPRDQPRRGRRRPRPRPVRPDAGRGAVGPSHRRALGHPVAAVDPTRSGHRGAEGPVPASGMPRRASRRLRDHGGGRRLRPDDGGDHGDARRRRMDRHRREVARHLGRRRRLLPAPHARRRRSREGDDLPRRQGFARRAPRPDARSTCTRSSSSIRSSRSRTFASATTGSSGRSGGASS